MEVDAVDGFLDLWKIARGKTHIEANIETEERHSDNVGQREVRAQLDRKHQPHDKRDRQPDRDALDHQEHILDLQHVIGQARDQRGGADRVKRFVRQREDVVIERFTQIAADLCRRIC